MIRASSKGPCLFLLLFTVCNVTAATAQVSGAVAAYSFEESSGTTTADTSGNNLTGTLVNGTGRATGKIGAALSFDGIDDYVNLGNPTQLRLTGSMTISAWIFPTGASPSNDDAVVVSKRNGGSSGYQLDTTPDTGPRTIGFKLTNSSGSNMVRYGATTLQLNQWYHITGVYDAVARVIHVYLNGVLDDGSAVGTVSTTQQNSSSNVNIGRRPGNGGRYEFKGRIDEVRIFGRALTAAEVQTLYGSVTVAPPTVTINQAAVQNDPTGASPVNFAAVFSEAVTGFTTGDVTVGGTAGATAATVSGSGTTYNVAVTGMTQPGTVTATIPAGVATGTSSGLANATSTSTDNAITFDNVRPSVTINQSVGQSDPTSASTISYTVLFSEAVTGFATGDVTLGGTAGATTATVSGNGTTYTVTVSGMTQNGTVIATVAAGTASDAAGNPSLASTSTDNTVTFSTQDSTPPSVTANQSAAQADPSNATVLNFTVVFSENVTGFTTGDVSLGGTAGATTANITGSGSTYTAAVSGMTQNGTVIVTVPQGVASDAAGNLNLASTSTDNSVTYDTVRPSVTINQAAGQADPTPATTISFTVTFSEAVTGFATGDVTLGGTAGATTASVTGSGTTYDVAVTGMTQAGSVIATVGAGVASDPAGNVNTASSSTDNAVAFDAPAVPSGALATYPFEEGTGTTAFDTSGNNLNGTLTNGPVWTTGKAGKALSFDGVDDFVELGNPAQLRLTGSMTISAWIFATGAPPINDDAAVLSKRNSGSSGYQLDTTPDTGVRTIGFKLTNSSGSNMIRYGATTLQANQWYHITGVYDATARVMHVYLNGALDDGSSVGTVTATQQDSSNNVNIGRRPGSPGGFEFNGKIDQVMIYGRALSAAEVMAVYNAGGSTDASAPQVSVTFPQSGGSVAGIVTITANASDDSGIVAGVQFFVDGSPVGAEDTTAPFAVSWDSRSVPNGVHTFSAIARDAAGHSGVSASVSATVLNTDQFVNEVLLTGLNLPTVIEFLPDGRMLIGLLGGTIHILQPGASEVDPTPFLQISNIGTLNSQQGLMDIVLDPDFATNNFLYVFYTLGNPNRDRVSRFTANGSTAGNEFVLWQDAEDANAEHHGGSLNFGNDGKLYITTGEHFNAAEAQSLTNYRGKILRFNNDGSIPTDNPFHDGNGQNRDAIWALGLRNPYRASYDRQTGWLLIGDVGGNDYSTAKEEVNLGIRGANYGWPNCEGSCSNPNYTSPIYFYPHNGRDAAVTGGFIYRGSQFPSQYYGSYFFADYTQNWIRRLTLDASGNVTGVFNFEPLDGTVDGPYGDIVYLTEGPDGALYYVDLGYSDIGGTFGLSKIRRIRYITGNQPPVASASANPVSGQPPLTVSFSSAGSSDPEGQSLTYSWNFGDGTSSSAANPTHNYVTSGQYTARLSVSDGAQGTTSAPISIRVGNPPTLTLLSPATGSFFQAGDAIAFSAEATDAEDGVLPASAFSWRINLRHSEHVHPALPQDGVTAGVFTIPTSGHDFSGDVYYEFIVTVTDSSGLQSSASALIYPRKVVLSFDSVPSGFNVTVDGIPRTTPFSFDTLVLFQHLVNAPNQTVGQTPYSFSAWSDGGTQQHTLVVPSSNQSYVATFTAGTTAPLPGLVARYTFEEATGTTTADVSGNNNVGTLSSGASWATGKYGNGTNLDGATGQVTVNDSASLDLSGSFTLAAWINPDTVTGFQTILIKEVAATCGYWLQTNGTQISSGFRPASGGCLDHQTTTANLSTGNWYHVAAVLDRSTNSYRIYLNGVSILNVTETSAPAPNNDSLVLGRTFYGEWWNGSLDDVRIYNRALSTSEIVQVMQGAP